MLRRLAGNMLHQILDPASEVGTQLVEHVRLDVGAMLVGQLRKRHPIQSGSCSDLLQLDSLPFPELQISNSLTQLES